ncbi:hypothetical protein ACGGAI_25560 [Streptomyces antibioticus]|uniref:hypothetical protein n=1 Tax=Streptomyces antibioticus TaxID=1890 RepID=UPI00371C29AC
MANSDDGTNVDFLVWAQFALGDNLLAYVLCCSLDSLNSLMSGETELSQRQSEVVQAISSIKASLPDGLDREGIRQGLRFWVTQVDGEVGAIAKKLREHVGGAGETVAVCDELEASIAELAFDAYPAFLLPPDENDLSFLAEKTNFRVSSVIFQHPQSSIFAEAAMEDKVFKKVFTEHNEHTGYVAFVLRNTGSGGGLQLSMIADLVLRAAWRQEQNDSVAPHRFVEEALTQLRLVRGALAGKPQVVLCRIGLAGVLLPTGRQLELDGARVRSVTDAEREVAPASLKGALATTDETGATVDINYDGDLVFEYSYPYKVRIRKDEESDLVSWPDDMLPPESLDSAIMKLRFSLLMAVERDYRALLIPTWRTFDEPLNVGYSMSWSDPRQSSNLHPVQLSEDEMRAWAEWYGRLNGDHFKRVELALSRTLRAAAERRDPSDVLIDAVIAWENLFGTKDGEPTFRITMCLARLLKSSPTERLELKAELGKIYTLRSKVVHGSAALKPADHPRCQRALEVAIEAIRVLATERVDILALPTGADRSAALLLEG